MTSDPRQQELNRVSQAVSYLISCKALLHLASSILLKDEDDPVSQAYALFVTKAETNLMMLENLGLEKGMELKIAMEKEGSP